jgi:Spy/CpxP family protein refolding chaperone
MMNRLRLLALAPMLALALPAITQQPAAPPAASIANAPVEQHLKVLAEKLDLTADQQDKARPILQEMHDSARKIMDDNSLSQDEKNAQIKPVFMKADTQLREFLTDEQKKKLDAMEQPHPEMHGSVNGSTPSPQR